jgi:hypothetical protein
MKNCKDCIKWWTKCRYIFNKSEQDYACVMFEEAKTTVVSDKTESEEV